MPHSSASLSYSIHKTAAFSAKAGNLAPTQPNLLAVPAFPSAKKKNKLCVSQRWVMSVWNLLQLDEMTGIFKQTRINVMINKTFGFCHRLSLFSRLRWSNCEGEIVNKVLLIRSYYKASPTWEFHYLMWRREPALLLWQRTEWRGVDNSIMCTVCVGNLSSFSHMHIHKKRKKGGRTSMLIFILGTIPHSLPSLYLNLRDNKCELVRFFFSFSFF